MPADWDLPALQQLWSDEDEAATTGDQDLMRDCERCRSAGRQADRPALSSRPDSQHHAVQLARSYMQRSQGAPPSCVRRRRRLPPPPAHALPTPLCPPCLQPQPPQVRLPVPLAAGGAPANGGANRHSAAPA